MQDNYIVSYFVSAANSRLIILSGATTDVMAANDAYIGKLQSCITAAAKVYSSRSNSNSRLLLLLTPVSWKAIGDQQTGSQRANRHTLNKMT